MEKKITILTIVLLVSVGFVSCKQSVSQNDDFITVGVTTSYPEKELILQDFMDVEYIALETTDDFLTQGIVLDIGKEILLVRNQSDDGNIFVYERTGKGLRIINRKGQGGEEYANLSFSEVTLDEENNEIFINGYVRANNILVYDLYGNFKRSIPKREGTNYRSLRIFDREHLIGREKTTEIDEKSTESQPFVIISKKDGSLVKDIRISFEQGINAKVTQRDGMFSFNVYDNSLSIFPFHDSWLLAELSSDTIFRLLSDYSITPFMARTPSVQSMNPEIFLFPVILTDRYYFLETMKKEIEESPGGIFPRTNLTYDRQENTIYRYTICNDDYATKKTLNFRANNSNSEIAFWQKIEAHELIEANEKGELKGKLKELTEELDDDPNPVIMLVKNRK